MSDWKETEIGKLPIHWNIQTIGDLIREKGIAVGVMYPGEYDKDGIPLIRVGDIKNGTIDSRVNFRISHDVNREYERTVLEGGELLVVLVGNPGVPVVVPKTMAGWNVARAIGVLRLVDKSDAPFVSYALQSGQVRHLLLSSCNTTVQPTLNLKELKQVIIPWPDKPIRTAITNILSSLNDKIALLFQQNQTLEQMAETLYRHWFIKQANEGWQVDTIGEYVSAKGGGTPSTNEPSYWNGDIHWTSPRDLSGSESLFMLDTSRKITHCGLEKISSGLLPVRTVLLSSRAPIGYLAITDIPVAINQGYIACVCDKGLSPWFVYCWLKTNMDTIINSANGSTFLEIPKATFRQLEFIVPPITLREKFDCLVSPWFEKIRINQIQIKTLEQLRDTLLPKLMSGEVCVTDILAHTDHEENHRQREIAY